MKLMTQKAILMTFLTLSLALMSNPLLAEVYKTVDKDGNVIYTDRPPADGSRPMDLPPLSVIEAPVYEQAAPEAVPEGEEIPLRTLRRNYRDFMIISPKSEESVWSPDGPVQVAWRVSNQLLPGMKVNLFVDGMQQASTTQSVIPIPGLERGEHTLTAELKDAKNRNIAASPAVTFFIRQPGLGVRPRVTPHGGG